MNFELAVGPGVLCPRVDTEVVAETAAGLLERQGAEIVKIVCLLELKGLHGRDRLSRYPVDTIVAYEGK